MKGLLPSLDPSTRIPTAQGASLLLVLVLGFFTSMAQNTAGELVFANPQLQKGPGFPPGGLDGATYLFRNVATNVDALVTIIGRSSSQVSLSAIDCPGPDEDSASGTGYDNSWQPKIGCKATGTDRDQRWWMEFSISFVEHNDNANPVSVEQFYVTALDVEQKSANVRQELSFYGLRSYSLEQNTPVSASSTKGCLTDPNCLGTVFCGPDQNCRASQSKSSEVLVTNFYTNCSRLVLRIGARTDQAMDGGMTCRLNSLWFKSFQYTILHTDRDPMAQIEFTADNATPPCGSRDWVLQSRVARMQGIAGIPVKRM
jgi:hypothetical protein